MFKPDLEKAEEPDQIANFYWIIEKSREFQKNISVQFSSVQSFSHVWLFVTPWTAARWASLFN